MSEKEYRVLFDPKDIQRLKPEGPEQEARFFRIMFLHGMMASQTPQVKPFIEESGWYFAEVAQDILQFWQRYKYIPQTDILIGGLTRFAAESAYAMKDRTPDIAAVEEKLLEFSLVVLQRAEAKFRKRSELVVWTDRLKEQYAINKQIVWEERADED